jgi:hypothetical protein
MSRVAEGGRLFTVRPSIAREVGTLHHDVDERATSASFCPARDIKNWRALSQIPYSTILPFLPLFFCRKGDHPRFISLKPQLGRGLLEKMETLCQTRN